jgi:outer membrane protein OmpA-like peptidoglycan-associated protein
MPENLGYPINTIEDDGSLAVASDGQTAFFASARADSRGGLDLYRFLLPKYASPAKTLWIKGTVSDAKTGKGLPSSVELKDIGTGEVLQKITTDEKGFYLVTLPVGKDYSFTINRTGYLYYSQQFLLAGQPPDSTYRKDIALQPIAVNTTMELKNILFETNSFKLKSSSNSELDKLVQLLIDNSTLKVQIAGHTDNIGKPADNMLLSTNRAKAVADYVIGKGLAKERITYKGYGITKPIADNNTEAGRARNRRTEMMVVGL